MVFGKKSYIRSDATGKEIEMRSKNGQFVLDVHMDELMASEPVPPFRRQEWP